jgi:selenide,water dikinase
MIEEVRLTQYSHGAGCGCKIAPNVLSEILKTDIVQVTDKKLLVGNDSRDDAAVYDLGDGKAVISTTDFFMPIVDDPFTFGKIAAINAMSDVYAMGGKPIMAIAILGWPLDKLDIKYASKVVDGGRQACLEAGIVLAGGHSIDSPEPIFGLAVTGQVDIKNLKQNNTATEDCKLYLTKPLGVGILSTAQKRGILKENHKNIAPDTMCKLNSVGPVLSEIPGVKAMTDVTGFSLLGHLSEMCEGSNLSAHIDYSKVPKIDVLQEYIDQKSMPGGTFTNWKSYGSSVLLGNDAYKPVLCDPQTSGGLLIAVDLESVNEVEQILKDHDLFYPSFGHLVKIEEKLITVK